jgi:general secretion pathway protein G
MTLPLDYASPKPDPPPPPPSRPPASRFGAIMLIVLVVALSVYRVTSRPRPLPNTSKMKAEMFGITASILTFKQDVGRYPTEAEGLKALVFRPTGVTGWRGPYFDQLPNDGWNHPYIYHAPKSPNGKDFQVLSAGPDGIEATPDDITN